MVYEEDTQKAWGVFGKTTLTAPIIARSSSETIFLICASGIRSLILWSKGNQFNMTWHIVCDLEIKYNLVFGCNYINYFIAHLLPFGICEGSPNLCFYKFSPADFDKIPINI